MGPLVANWSWPGAEFLAWSLVVTFLVSRLFLWLLKRLSDRFARALIANGLSLVLCGIVYGLQPSSGYNFHYFPDVMAAISDFCLPQGVWILLDIILETRRLARAEHRSTPLQVGHIAQK